MNIYKIRILTDDQDDFIRELEIKSNQTFKELYDFIMKNLIPKGNELASFHIVDNNWIKQQEITLINMSGKAINTSENEGINTTYLMNETTLDSFLWEIDQKMIFEYDFLQMHTFKLELIDISSVNPHVAYPVMVYSRGKISLKNSLIVEKDPEKLKEELLKEFNALLAGDEDDYDVEDENF